MGANYGLLSYQQLPQMQNAPVATGILNGVQQAQKSAIDQQNANTQSQNANTQSNLVNSQVKEIAQKMSLQDLDTTSNIFGAVSLNPSPASYQQALMAAHKAGLDISDAPTTWGSDAQSFVNNAAVLSKQALEWKQANAQLAITQAQLNNASADVNIKAQQNGLATPFPSAPGGSNYNPGNTPTLTAPGQTPTMQNAPAAPGVVPSANMGGPAGLAGDKTNQEEQAKNWQTLLDKSQGLASQYETNKSILNQARVAADTGISSGPLIGHIKANTPSGQLLDKNSALIQQNMIKQLVQGGGLGRVMQAELGMITAATPDNSKYSSVNDKIIDNLHAANEVINGLQPKLLQRLNAMGIRDPNLAGNVMDEVITRAKVFDPKTGNVDKKALSTLPSVMTSTLKDLREGKLFTDQDSTSNSHYASLLQDTPEVRTQIKQQFPNASDDQISQMIQMQNQKLQQQQTAEKKSPMKSAREIILQ
jgi:hypothetical protein